LQLALDGSRLALELLHLGQFGCEPFGLREINLRFCGIAHAFPRHGAGLCRQDRLVGVIDLGAQAQLGKFEQRFPVTRLRVHVT
jgi:hypothetical protein